MLAHVNFMCILCWRSLHFIHCDSMLIHGIFSKRKKSASFLCFCLKAPPLYAQPLLILAAITFWMCVCVSELFLCFINAPPLPSLHTLFTLGMPATCGALASCLVSCLPNTDAASCGYLFVSDNGCLSSWKCLCVVLSSTGTLSSG